MKILIITQDDPFYIPHFFREFFDHGPQPDIDVHGIVILAPLGKKSLSALVRQMYAFYGPVDFLRMGTRFALRKVMNFLAIRLFGGRLPGTFSLEHFLLKRRIPIVHTSNVNGTAFLDTLRPLGLDLIVSVAASQKFGSDLLALPRYGAINIHNARLPRNRGMLPNFWSLYRYDTEPTSAMTVHKMNEKLDDGPIVLQEEFRLDPSQSLHELIVETKRLNAHAILKALGLYRSGEPPLLPNDASLATYNTFPTGEDVRRFRAKGLRLL